MIRRLLLLAAAIIASASAAHAQDATLDRVQHLSASGRFTEARSTLEQWERTNANPRSNATPADRARALYLKGTLATDPKEAEDAYLGVVFSYPSSPSAAGALLRLGQGFLTAGEPHRAVAYLERLRSDYPGSPHRETGWLWLARAHRAAGAAGPACAAAREGLDNAANANLVTLLEIERDNACVGRAADTRTPPASTRVAADPEPGAPARSQVAVDREPAPAPTRTAIAADPEPSRVPSRTGVAADPAPSRAPSRTGVAADPEPAPARDASRAVPAPSRPADAPTPRPAADPAPAPTTGTTARPRTTTQAFAVQIAAFRERSSADAIQREMRTKGFTTRIIQLDGSPLFRVRYGEFTTREQALAAAQRIRDAGFEAFIVDDVRAER